MNRRDFMTVFGGVGAAAVLGDRQLLASDDETTSFYVRGLVMLTFDDPNYLRLAIPEAHGHKAMLSIVPDEGDQRTLPIKGHGALEGIAPNGQKPDLHLPELLHIREIYRDATPKIDDSPSIISIPWSAIRSVRTNTVSDHRWTFTRTDTGEEVNTVRPRKIAESLKIELVSSSTLKLNNGKASVALSRVQELWTDFIPIRDDIGDFVDHFAHYMPYVDTSEAFHVIPKRLGPPRRRATVPPMGNSYATVWPDIMCFLLLM